MCEKLARALEPAVANNHHQDAHTSKCVILLYEYSACLKRVKKQRMKGENLAHDLAQRLNLFPLKTPFTSESKREPLAIPGLFETADNGSFPKTDEERRLLLRNIVNLFASSLQVTFDNDKQSFLHLRAFGNQCDGWLAEFSNTDDTWWIMSTSRTWVKCAPEIAIGDIVSRLRNLLERIRQRGTVLVSDRLSPTITVRFCFRSDENIPDDVNLVAVSVAGFKLRLNAFEWHSDTRKCNLQISI